MTFARIACSLPVESVSSASKRQIRLGTDGFASARAAVHAPAPARGNHLTCVFQNEATRPHTERPDFFQADMFSANVVLCFRLRSHESQITVASEG